ncbi:MAG TPA: molybdopterin-dependent oxidoreductase [Vicinamibacterales bacterium]|nr:molybdopterin-dependent oxidoreductase [Vicinamibacterales bacterium]
MANQRSRREILKGGLAAAGLGVLGVPEWVLPALAQGETVVQFTDIPDNVRWDTPPDRRLLDVRTIEGPFTPTDKFATTQHYGHPDVDIATYKLKISGLVDKPLQLTLDEVKKFGSSDLVFGFECSGNRGPIQGLCGNGRWTGVPLKKVLDAAGVKASAREFVFFGADKGEEEVEWRTQKYKIDVPFGRSLNREKAMSDWPFLAWALNGEPLTKHQGKPLRLLTPGWYGVANVKWLSQIHIQEDAYLGKYQARWYRTVRGEMIDGEMKYMETAVTHMNPKSFVARVTKNGGAYKVLGVILNDGTPIKSVEVKVDEGPWQAATLDPATAKDKYGWKLFTYNWANATPGDHTLVSRVTQTDGKVQPTEQELETKKSFLEQNSQAPRKVKIA